MTRTTLALLLLLLGCEHTDGDDIGRIAQPVIVGDDDRQEWYEADDVWQTRAAESIAAVVLSERVQVEEDGSVTLSSMSVAESATGGVLCDDVRYRDQPSLAHCSGTLVGEDVILTASHCLTSPDCSNLAFVFDFRYRAEGELETIDASDVYGCREIIAGENESFGDFVFLRLDRPVEGDRVPLELALEPPSDGASLHMLGFPLGVPLKVTPGEVVVSGEAWRPLIDSFGGNSGSSLLDEDGRVRGILLGTAGSFSSFEEVGGCFREAHYEEDRANVPAYATSSERLVAAYCAEVGCDGSEPDAGTVEVDAGVSDPGDRDEAPGSGGCSAAPPAQPSPFLALVLLGLALVRKRR